MNYGMDIAITGIGVVSPVGLSAPATCSALRAGIARMGEIQTYGVDGEFFDKKPVIGGRVPTEWFEGEPVPEEWPGHERFQVPTLPPREAMVVSGVDRLIELAVPAACEAWQSTVQIDDTSGVMGLYIGLDDFDESTTVVAAITEAIGRIPEIVVEERAGRAASLTVLHRSIQDLLAGRITIALVGGVDSLIRAEVLERLDEEEILRSDSRPQGVIPGEAAAFVVIEHIQSAKNRGVPIRSYLLSTAVAEEPTADTEDPNQGIGLTRALREARQGAENFETPLLIVCDLNGDRYRGLEWSLASIRVLGNLHGKIDIWHPADCIGDSGAASGILNIIWAVTALQKKYAKTERVLVWGASAGKARAAAVVACADIS